MDDAVTRMMVIMRSLTIPVRCMCVTYVAPVCAPPPLDTPSDRTVRLDVHVAHHGVRLCTCFWRGGGSAELGVDESVHVVHMLTM